MLLLPHDLFSLIPLHHYSLFEQPPRLKHSLFFVEPTRIIVFNHSHLADQLPHVHAPSKHPVIIELMCLLAFDFELLNRIQFFLLFLLFNSYLFFVGVSFIDQFLLSFLLQSLHLGFFLQHLLLKSLLLFKLLLF